jgi:hypothetical protein
LITTVIDAAIAWLPGGLTGRHRIAVDSSGISGLAFSLMYKRYIGVLEVSAHDETDWNARAERQRRTQGDDS